MSNFDVFLCKSEKLRNGYVKSLEKADENFRATPRKDLQKPGRSDIIEV